ncbi:response regulator transcription factor [Phenylobacterium sp.]|uniref:response regulator transcription factor n=1 Tax=Phenylobacterium sp. TaxID=1871053 RepID=UPI002DF084ED|nr:response regulator transcription factor [Phenylobacterium sp.]
MNAAARVLLVDDDEELAATVGEYLREEGFAPDWARDAATAMGMWAERGYDIVVLDVMMPGENGLELLKRLRRETDAPVLMLTARAEELDKVLGLELGADDYLTKPFHLRELAARLRAILRRLAVRSGPETLRVGGLVLHRRALSAEIDGRPARLTVAEFMVLEALARSAGRVCSRADLALEALGRPLTAYDRSVDTHVSNLRRKLGLAVRAGLQIRNIRNQGYLLAEEAARP